MLRVVNAVLELKSRFVDKGVVLSKEGAFFIAAPGTAIGATPGESVGGGLVDQEWLESPDQLLCIGFVNFFVFLWLPVV